MRQRADGAATATPATSPMVAARRAAWAYYHSSSVSTASTNRCVTVAGRGMPPLPSSLPSRTIPLSSLSRVSGKMLKVLRSSICTSRPGFTTIHTASRRGSGGRVPQMLQIRRPSRYECNEQDRGQPLVFAQELAEFENLAQFVFIRSVVEFESA